jgi:hypothetical protein
MKTIRLAALLVALATPAWAFNNDKPQHYTNIQIKPFQVCVGVGTLSDICGMKHAPEDDALTMAQNYLKICSEGGMPDECPVILACVKQRWDY